MANLLSYSHYARDWISSQQTPGFPLAFTPHKWPYPNVFSRKGSGGGCSDHRARGGSHSGSRGCNQGCCPEDSLSAELGRASHNRLSRYRYWGGEEARAGAANAGGSRGPCSAISREESWNLLAGWLGDCLTLSVLCTLSRQEEQTSAKSRL